MTIETKELVVSENLRKKVDIMCSVDLLVLSMTY